MNSKIKSGRTTNRKAYLKLTITLILFADTCSSAHAGGRRLYIDSGTGLKDQSLVSRSYSRIDTIGEKSLAISRKSFMSDLKFALNSRHLPFGWDVNPVGAIELTLNNEQYNQRIASKIGLAGDNANSDNSVGNIYRWLYACPWNEAGYPKCDLGTFPAFINPQVCEKTLERMNKSLGTEFLTFSGSCNTEGTGSLARTYLSSTVTIHFNDGFFNDFATDTPLVIELEANCSFLR